MGESLIVAWLDEQQAVFPGHSGRASVNILSGALTLSAVTLADSGVYVVEGTDPQLRASASITVVGKRERVSFRPVVSQENKYSMSFYQMI